MSFFATAKEIRSECENYFKISFMEKSKNQLALFYIACVVLTFVVGIVLKHELININTMIGSLVYLVFAPFIFMNHKWAMYTSAFLYMLDKITIVALGSGSNAVGSLIFGYACIALTYKAVKVSKSLKTLKNEEVGVVERLNDHEESKKAA